MDRGATRADPWAIILDDRPKQFCALMDGKTLLGRTLRRVRRGVRHDRICLALTRAHEPFYAPLVADAPPESLVVAAVALFPADHHVADDARFMAHVADAFRAVRARPELVVLLGIEAETPEVQYGWIEPGTPIPAPSSHPVYRVRRLWEKPGLALAEQLLRRGCPYARLDPVNFSAEVLGRHPARLAVLPVRGVGWCDWGDPGRVLRTLARLGHHPDWSVPVVPVSAAGGTGAR